MPLLPSWLLYKCYAIITINALMEMLCHYYHHGSYLNVMPLLPSWLLSKCYAMITTMTLLSVKDRVA